MLKPGDTVTVIVSPLRNGDPAALLKQITLADGRTVHERGRRGAGDDPVRPAMRVRLIAAILAAAAVVPAFAQTRPPARQHHRVLGGLSGARRWIRIRRASRRRRSRRRSRCPKRRSASRTSISGAPCRHGTLELTRKGLPPPSSGMACMPEGVPGMMGATFPLEILETPGQVTIIEEAFNQVRRIYLNAPAIAPEDAEPRFAGHSVGKWEGTTLVVTTVGVKESVRFRNVPHSMRMRVTERMRMVSDEVLENQVTIDDPEYLTGRGRGPGCTSGGRATRSRSTSATTTGTSRTRH